MAHVTEQPSHSADLALGLWANRMANALILESNAYAALARHLSPAREWSTVADLTGLSRQARQALLFAAVKLRADESANGLIPREDWLKLAAHFGYDTRGTAGFFRRSPDGSPGLMIRRGGRVGLAAAGLARMEAFRQQISARAADIEATRQL